MGMEKREREEVHRRREKELEKGGTTFKVLGACSDLQELLLFFHQVVHSAVAHISGFLPDPNTGDECLTLGQLLEEQHLRPGCHCLPVQLTVNDTGPL